MARWSLQVLIGELVLILVGVLLLAVVGAAAIAPVVILLMDAFSSPPRDNK